MKLSKSTQSTTSQNMNMKNNHPLRRKTARILAGSIAALLAAQSAQAAALTWDIGAGDAPVVTDGSGTWSNGLGNWTDTVADLNWSNATPDDAIFGTITAGTLGAAGTVTLGSAITAGSLTFNAALGGGTYTIDTATFALTLNTGITANESAIIQSGGGSLVLGANNAWSVAATKTLTVSSTISGLGFGIATSGAGALTLTNTNTYTGQTDVQAGTLNASATDALGTGANLLVSGGTLAISTFNQTVGAVSLTLGSITGSSGTLTGTSFAVESGIISANLAGLGAVLTKTTAGTVTLSGTNTYTGGTNVDGGVLALDSAGALGTTGTISFGGGTLQFSASNTTDYSARFSAAAGQAISLDTNGQPVTLATAMNSVGGTLTKSGGGTLTVSATNGYDGGTFVNGGTLSTSNAAAFGAGAITLANGTTFLPTGGGTPNFTNAFNLTSGTATVAVPFGGGADPTISGLISGGGALTVTSDFSGRGLILPNANTFLGNLTLSGGNVGTRLIIGNVGSLGAGALVVSINSTIGGLENSADLSAGAGVTNNIQITTGSKLNVGNNSTLAMQLSGIISDAGSLTKLGSGTITLSGVNNYSGGTTVSSGTLAISGAGTFGAVTGALTVSGATAIANLGGTSQTVGAVTLQGGAQINNGTLSGTSFAVQNGSASAILTGTGALTKTTADLVILTGANSFTGATTISQGALRISDANGLGTTAGNTTVSASGAALQLNGAGISYAAEALSLSGTGISTGGALQNLSGNNTWTGAITLAGAAAIGSDSGTLTLTGGISGAQALTFAGAGDISVTTTAINANVTPINKIGTGTLTFAVNSNLVVAPININAGTFTISTGVLGSTGAFSVAPGATVNLTSITANRLGGRPISLNGSILNVSGAAAETTGQLTVASGHSIINNTSGSTLALGHAAVVRNYADAGSGAGGTVLFKGGSTINFSVTPTFTGQSGGNNATNKAILPWALFDAGAGNGTSFATTDAPGTTLRALAGTESVNVLSGNNNAVLTSNPAATNTVTVNSITFNTGASAVTINSPTLAATAVQTLTVASGGILSTVAGATISGGVLAPSTHMIVFTPGTASLDISSAITGGGGVAKAGAGTLTLASNTAAYAGYSANTITNGSSNRPFFSIGEGTVTLGANNAFGYGRPGLQIYTGATLNLNGKIQWLSTLSSQLQANAAGTVPGVADGGIVTSTTGGSIVLTMQNSGGSFNNTFSGSIQGTGVGLARSGESTSDLLILRGNNTYTGPTLINGGGSGSNSGTILRDGGRISGTSNLDVNYTGFTIDNTSLTNNTDRVNDAAAVGLRGASLYFLGRAQTASTETLGTVTLDQGRSIITVTPGGGAGTNSADLTITTLARTAASGVVVNFAAGGGTLGTSGSNPHIAIGNGGSLTVNNILPWATVGNEFASYIPYTSSNGVTAGGVGALNAAGYAGYTGAALPGSDAPTGNYAVGSANFALASLTLNSFNANNSSMTFGAAGNILNVASGGLIFGGGVKSIGASPDSGRITAGGTATATTTDLLIFNGNNTTTLNSRIIDTATAVGGGNTGKVRAVFSGTNQITMNNGLNDFSGGAVVNNGVTLALEATSGVVIPNATTAANGLVINGGTVTMTNSAGQIGSGNIVTLNGGSSTLNLFGNNTLEGLVMNFNGAQSNSGAIVNTTPTAFNALASSTGITLTLGASGLTTTASTLTVGGSASIITGRVNLASTSTLNIGGATFNGQLINPLREDFTLTGLSGGGGTTTKSGTGMLRLNTATTLTGTLDVTGGGLQIGASGAGARLANVILQDGTRINLNGQPATFGSLATGGTGTGLVTNTGSQQTLTVGFSNASTTFGGKFIRFNDAAVQTINLQQIGTGTLTLTGTGHTATGTLTINSTGGGGVSFKDAYTNNFVQSAITVNAGGTLTLDDTGTSNLSNRLTNAGVTLSGGTFVSTANTAGSTETTTAALTLNTGESTVTINQGSTSNVTTFGSLGFGTGGTGTVTGTGVGTSNNNKLMLTGAPGLTNNILPRLAVGTDFATYNQDGNGVANTFGVQAMTTYSAATDLNAAATSGTLKTSTTTGLSLTATKQINAININTNSTAITSNGSLLPTQGLTLAAGAVLVNGTGATVSTPVLALSAEGIFRVNSGQDLTVSSRITGGSGLTKTGAGSLTLSKLQEYTGTTTVNQGTLTFGTGVGKNPLLVTVTNANVTAPALQLNGGTFDLNGNSQVVGNIASSNTFAGGGGTITNNSLTAATLTSYLGSGTFGGKITGNLNFTLVGNSNGVPVALQTFRDQQSYTGNTVIRGGELNLQAKGALYVGVGGTPNVELNFASLNLDNSGLNPSATPPDRIPTNASISLNQSTIRMTAGASIDNIFNLGRVTADRGLNMVGPFMTAADSFTLANSNGATVTATIDNLTNTSNGGVVNLFGYSNGTNLGHYTTSQAERLFITQVNGVTVTSGTNQILPAWVGASAVGGNGNVMNDFATLSSTGWGIVKYGDTAKGAPAYSGTLATGNVTSVGATNLTVASTTTKALQLTGALTFGTATNSLNIESGGLFTTTTSIGASANSGVLTAGGTASSGTTDLVLAYGSNSGFALNSAVKDTSTVIGSGTAKVRLVLVNGNGTFTITGNNTHSGGTVLMTGREGAGGWVLGGAGVIIPAGGLTLYPFFSGNQKALSAAAGQIDPANDVTIVGGNMGLTLTSGAVSLSSVIFQNRGSTGTPLVNISAGSLALTKTTANGYVIDATNDNLAGTAPTIQISGTGTSLTIPDGSTINAAGEAPTDLVISAPLLTAAATSPLIKTGSGSVQFTNQNSFTNGFNLDGGSIVFTASSVGGGTGGAQPTTSQIGRGTLTLADGTAIMGSVGVNVGNVIATANGATFTFGTLDATNARANANNNLTLTNTVTLGTGAQGINVNGLNMTGTIGGQLTGGGTGFTKGGPGTLVLNNATNNFTGSVTINGGTLTHNVGGSIPTGRIMTVAAGAAFNMNAIAQSIDSLNGAGSIINPGGATTLTINGSTNGSFSGVLAATTAANLRLTKLGANTQTLSGANVYAGVTTVGGGILRLENANALPGGVATAGGTSNLTFNGGIIGLGSGNSSFTRSLNTAATATAVTFTGTGGFAAYGTDATVNFGGGGTVDWGTASTGLNGQTLILGASTADKTVTVSNALTLGASVRTLQVDNGSAVTDGILTGAISGTAGTGGLTKTGAGTVNLDNALQSYDILNANAGTTNVNGVLGTGSGTAVVAVNNSGTKLRFGTVSQTLSSLTIGAGSTVIFTSGTASGSLTGGSGGGKAPGFGGGSAVVPEPGTLGLLLVGALGLLNRRRRQA